MTSAQGEIPSSNVAPVDPAGVAVIPAIPPPTQPHPIDPRTGEPRPPWAVRCAATALFLSAAVTGVAVLLVYWVAAGPELGVELDRFGEASVLMGLWHTQPGSVWRVLLAIAVTVVAIVVAGVTSVVGYYSYAGYRWTRLGGLVAFGVSCLALLLNQLAWAALPLAALGAGLLWLPSTDRYFAAWHARRHPEPVYAPPVAAVHYGPLPRYR